jgi:hypothetical protein
MSEPISATNLTTSPTRDVYHVALLRAFKLQAFFALLVMLNLDGGIFRRAFGFVSVGFWIGVVCVLMLRPGEWGLRYLRYGVLIAFAATVAAMEINYDWIVDLVSR